jgi:DNA-binding transcriptional LysR family regulator
VGALPDLTIRQLEYLVAVADEATWSAAATRVGVSGSALSQGLAELERRVGVALFERVGRRRLLRDAARPVLDHARQVLALTTDLAAWADEVRSGQRGDVRVGMIDAAAVIHFPDVLRTFRTDHPDVDLHLTVAPSAELFEQLRRGDLDLVVGAAPSSATKGRAVPAGAVIEPLFDEPLVVCAPPDTPPRPPAQWGPWVLFPASSHTRATITAALTAAGADVRVVAESHQPEVLREMVQLGLGWTVLPAAQATAEPRPLIPQRDLGSRQLVLVRRTTAVVDPAVDELASSLASAAQRVSGGRPGRR